jgi:hypothetical protein
MNDLLGTIQSFLGTLFSGKKTGRAQVGNAGNGTPEERSFQFQLEMLSKEIDMIDSFIARLDEQGRAFKNWAILVWGGAIVAVLGQTALLDLRKYIFITALVPLLFWAADTRWSYMLRRAVYRLEKISQFITGADFETSFEKSRLVNFWLFDIRAHKHKPEFKKKITYLNTMLTRPELYFFYGGQIFLSVALGILFWMQ